MRKKTINIKSILCNNYHWICIISLFLYSLYVMSYVILSSDDYTYKQVAVCNIGQIADFMKWHIVNYNGRTLVHILIIAFLKYDIGFIIWKVLCSVCVALSVPLIGKIVSKNKEEYKLSCLVTALLFITVSQIMFNRSIFWLSGSFNYFLPTLYTLFIVYIAFKHDQSKWLFPLSFIGGALNEQNGIMVVGVFTLLLLDGLVSNKKVELRKLFCLLLSVAGYLTVMLSPGTFSRVEKQGEYTITDFVRNVITIFRQNILDNKNTVVLMFFVSVSVIYWLYKLSDTNKVIRIFNKLLIVAFSALTLFNGVLVVFWLWNEKFFNSYTLNPKINIIVMLLWFLYVLVFTGTIVYTSLLIYFTRKNSLPFITIALALGSNIMMAISKKLVYRYCTAGIFMFILFVVYTFVCFIGESNKYKKLKKVKIIVKYTAVVLCIVFSIIQANSAVNYLNIANEKETVPLSDSELIAFENRLSSGNYYSSIFWSNLHDITNFSTIQNDYSSYVDTNYSKK